MVDFPGLDLSRLKEAFRWSRDRLKSYRLHRNEAVKAYVGRNYSDGGSLGRVAVNLIELAAGVFTRQLVPRNPRVLVRTQDRSLKGTALRFEFGLNDQIVKLDLESRLITLAKDAVFSMGIAKIGLGAASADDVPYPFVEPVDLDDWVQDMSAKRSDEIRYMGNRYRIPLDEALESSLFDEQARNLLQRGSDQGLPGNRESEARQITQSTGPLPGEHERYVELWDIWLPGQNLILTMMNDLEGEPMRIEEWTGDPHGPYHRLGFDSVPGNVLPLAPIAVLKDLHDITNAVYDKVTEQIKDHKTILLYSGAAAGDADRMSQAADGHGVRVDRPQESQERQLGNYRPDMFLFAMQARDLFSRMAGNLDALGGLGPQSETLGQDELLFSSASRRIQSMQAEMIRFTTGIVRSLGWYLWQDPLLNLKIRRPVGDTGIFVKMNLTPENRMGSLDDYDIKIEPYSATIQSPQNRLASLLGIYNQFIAPNLQFIAQQGMTVNYQTFLELIARYTDMSELEDILVFGGQPTQTQIPAHRAVNVPVGPKAPPARERADGNGSMPQELRELMSLSRAAAPT